MSQRKKKKGGSFFLLNSISRSRLEKLRRFAEKPENWYHPQRDLKTKGPPGDNQKHRVRVGNYRVVFSLTHMEENNQTYRHMSISVPSENRYPLVQPVLLIGFYLGFDGYESYEQILNKPPDEKLPASWMCQINEPTDETLGHVVVVQTVPKARNQAAAEALADSKEA